MRKLQSANLKLHTKPAEQAVRGWEDWVDIWLITLLFCLGSVLLLADALQVSAAGPALAAVLWTAAAVSGQQRRLRPWCLPVCLALALVLGVVFLTPARSALAALANDFLTWLSGVRRHVYLRYTGADAKHLWALCLVVCPAAAGLSAHFAVRGARWHLLLLLLPAAACLAGWWEFGPGAWLLVLGAVWQLLRAVRLRSHGFGQGGFAGRSLCVAAVCAAVLVALLAGGLGGVDTGLRQTLERELHSLRYDQATNSMPEGRLRDLPGWNPTDQPALEVTMEQPQKLYLRSYIGEVYTPGAWTALPEEVIAQHGDLFYWLHQNDFYAQGILAGAYRAMGQTQTESITVKNISACSARLALAYAGDVRTLADDRMIGDTAVLAEGDSYTTGYFPGSIPQWFVLQNEIATSDPAGSGAAYRICEQAYHEFAEENYLEIPADTRQVLAEALGSPDSGKSLSEIKDAILTYLEENMTYQPYLATDNGSADFVSYTLQQSRTGYSVHYATIATLMLRYFGIPARYCEGYFLSGQQAQQYSGDQTIVLDETYAHAWTEYYLDGVGWLPFEVTPGYVDREELEGEGLGGGGRTYTSPQHLPEELLPEDDTPQGRQPSWNWRLVWLLPALAVLVLLGLMIWRRLRLRRRLRAIDAAGDREAIIQRFAYAAWLMERGALAQQDVPGYEDARRLQLEALYSTHEMCADQRRQTDAFAAGVLQQCKSRWSLPRRWYNHWIQCLY